jgi:hypothetical protein
MNAANSLPRTITLLVALATLASNVISSVLFSQLPDDPFHLASNFRWYLHFANVLSVFGFLDFSFSNFSCLESVFPALPSIPARHYLIPSHQTLERSPAPTPPYTRRELTSKQQHALSIAIFSNYLLLDTILCAIPRMLLLGLFQSLSAPLCASPPESPFSPDSMSASQNIAASSMPASQWELLTSNWTPGGCYQIVRLTQLALAAGVVAGTALQFVGALYVRDYARELWIREMREEALSVRAVDGDQYQILLPGSDEERYSDEEVYVDDVVGREKF